MTDRKQTDRKQTDRKLVSPKSVGVISWIAAAALVLAGVGITASNLIPTRTLRAATEDDLERQETLNRRLEQRLVEIDTETERVLHDPVTNERILRDEYRMSRPGEVVVPREPSLAPEAEPPVDDRR